MPGGLVRLHSFRFVRRTQDEVVYAERRRSTAFNALVGGVTMVLSAFLFLHLGFLGRYPWVLGCLNGLREAESWGERVPSLILLPVFLLWPLHVAFFAWVLIRGLVPRELHIRLGARSVVLRKVPFFWRQTELTFREGEVDAVELSIRERRRGQKWAGLRLRLATGRVVKLDEGLLTAEISQMASEIATALAARQARS